MNSRFLYPANTTEHTLNILKRMRDDAQDRKNGPYIAGVLNAGGTETIIAVSGITQSIFILGFSETGEGDSSVEYLLGMIKSRMEEYIANAEKLKNKVIEVNTQMFSNEDAMETSIWEAIGGTDRTGPDVFSIIESGELEELSENAGLNSLEFTSTAMPETSRPVPKIKHVAEDNEREVQRLLLLCQNAIIQIVDKAPVCIGVESGFDTASLTRPNGLAPALLIYAAINWKPYLLTQKKEGEGFLVRLRTLKTGQEIRDEGGSAIEEQAGSWTGYTVSAIKTKSPHAFAIPVAETIRKCMKTDDNGKPVCKLDDMIMSAAIWLDRNGYDGRAMMRIVHSDA